MKEVPASSYISDDLPHYVDFHSLYHGEIKEMIKLGTDRFGIPLNNCKNEECACKISRIYPEIMTSDKENKIFVCPFCYYENMYNQTWGYSVHTNITDHRTAMGYKFVVYFQNKEDACLFYMTYCSNYSSYMTLFLKEDS
jgi:hypothetical protein